MRILHIDDSKKFQRLVETLISHEFPEAHVDAAPNFRVARELLKDHAYDLIIAEFNEMLEKSGAPFRFFESFLPNVPLILTCVENTNDRFLQAVRLGAEGFLAKEEWHLEGPERIRAVVHATRMQSPTSLSNALFQEQTNRFALPTERRIINNVARYVSNLLQIFAICPSIEQTRVILALEEALVNAMYHGNLEVGSELRGVDDEAYHNLIQERLNDPKYNQRRVDLTTTITNSVAKFVIRDQGAGFDIQHLPDPRDDENVERPHGRGIFLMRSFMDEVVFNKLGNQVTMVKYKTEHEKRPTDSSI